MLACLVGCMQRAAGAISLAARQLVGLSRVSRLLRDYFALALCGVVTCAGSGSLCGSQGDAVRRRV